MKQRLGWLVIGLAAGLGASAQAEIGILQATYSEAKGIGAEAGVMRRDPSDIIKVGDLYYVWYSKGTIAPGYDATVWHATSPDGHIWTEQGMALAKGELGSWEGASVFTPHILVAEGRYWLFYTGTSQQFGKGFNPDSKIGIAVSDSPDGPYVKYVGNPVIPGNHEVLVWPQGKGVAAMIGTTGPKEITRSIMYAEDGLHFSKTNNILDVPAAAGVYRPEAFTDSDAGKRIQWGVHIGTQRGSLPFIQRLDLVEAE